MPLMPEGVEHLPGLDVYPVNDVVNMPLMPEGVEHIPFREGILGVIG